MLIFFIIELLLYTLILIGGSYVRKAHKEHKPAVSVIVSAYRESEEDILKCVRSIKYEGELEILLILDEWRPLIIPNVTIVGKTHRQGHAHSMNVGIQRAKGDILVMLDADTSLAKDAIDIAVRHFEDERVGAVSGTLRVRNNKTNLLTRMQDIEYTLGIEVGRRGLSSLGSLNVMSGAFSVVRKHVAIDVGGWTDGAAEDLDFTMKMHIAGVEIVHEAGSIAYTEAPDDISTLFKQRLRWDGDMYYIYVIRYWKAFRDGLVPFRQLVLIAWSSFFLQLVMPFVIIANLGMASLVGAYYLALCTLMYMLVRPMPTLLMPVYLLYALTMRILAPMFILNEALFKAHAHSKYLPNKGKENV